MPNIRPKISTIEYQGFKVLVSACATLVLGQAVQDIVNPTKINVIEKLCILLLDVEKASLTISSNGSPKKIIVAQKGNDFSLSY